MATTSSSESERREWQDLDQRWRNGIEEAFGCRDHHALKIEALEDLKQELRNYHTQDGTSTSGGYHQVSDVLTTALDNLLPFVKAVETASQWQRASQLIWIGVLALVEVFIFICVSSLFMSADNGTGQQQVFRRSS